MKWQVILASSLAVLLGCVLIASCFVDEDKMETRQAQETADRVNGNDFILLSFKHNGAGCEFRFQAQWEKKHLELSVPQTHSRYHDFVSLKKGDAIVLKKVEKEPFVRASFVAAYLKPEGGPLEK